MNTLPRISWLLLAGMALTGCTLVTSSKTEVSAPGEGIAYYLPKRYFEIVIEQKVVPKADAAKLEKALLDSAAEVAQANKEAGAAEAERSKLEFIAKQSAGEPNEAEAAKAAAVARTRHKMLVDIANKASVKYVDARSKYLETPKKEPKEDESCSMSTTMSVKPLALVPDTGLRFSGNLAHSIFRSDELTLTTTGSGLLSGAVGKAEDKTAEAVLTLVNAIAARGASQELKTSMSTWVPPRSTPPAACVDARAALLTDFSEFKQGTVGTEVVHELNLDSPKVKLVLHAVKGEPRTTPADVIDALCKNSKWRCADAANVNGHRDMAGLAYRRDLTHMLSILPSVDVASEKSLASTLVTMPNMSPTEFLPLPTGAFTNVSYTVAFDNGMLTSYAATRPSEALGFVKIPYDIALALVSIPAQIFKLRVDLTTQKGSLAAKEIELLNQLQALDEARKAKNDPDSATTPDPATQPQP